MKIFIIGEDRRSLELKKIYENEIVQNYYEADAIITAVPFTRDYENITGTEFKIKELITFLRERRKILISGSIPIQIRDKLVEEKIVYYDLMGIDSLAIKNAVPTAEGAINVAISSSNITLNSSNILIMGYGRIGKILANMLRGFGANIYIEARKESDLAYIKANGYNAISLIELENHINKFDFIFNTIPQVILDENKLKLVKKEALIVDLASPPGGVDYQYAKENGINVEWALALPTKIAPKTAALYFKEEIDKIVNSPC